MSSYNKAIVILLADDDEDDRMLTTDALHVSKLANDLKTVNDGEELMDYLFHRGKYAAPGQAPRPGLVLLDLNMPHIDGVRALQQLRATSLFHDVPVIILSGDDDPAKRREVAHLGIFRFLKKESNSANVVSALNDFLGFYNYEASSQAE